MQAGKNRFRRKQGRKIHWSNMPPPPKDTPAERAEKDRLIAKWLKTHRIKKLPSPWQLYEMARA